MTSTIKIIITSILVGIVTYLLIGFINTRGLTIPNDGAAFAQLLVIIAAILLACFVTSSTGRATSPSTGRAKSSSQRETGTVKWFNVKKGYGFITRDQGDDVFVHYRSIEGDGRRSIVEDQRVSFIVTTGDKGPQAEEVTDA